MAFRPHPSGCAVRRRGPLLLAVILGVGIASPAAAIDLLDSYQRAQQSDPVIVGAQYALAAAQEKRPQARAGLLPTLAANGNYGHADNKVRFGQTDETGRNIESYGWNLELVQPLIRAQNWAAYAQAGEQVAQAEAEFEQAQQDLILRVAQAYFGVLLAQDGVMVAEAQEAATKQQLAQAQRSFKVGTVPITDVFEARSRLGIAESQKLAALNEQESQRAELQRLTGWFEGELAPLKDDLPLPRPQPESLQSWMDDAQEHHPAVRARMAAVRVLERELSRNRSARLPTLDMTASMGQSYVSGNTTIIADTDSFNRSAQVGLQVSLPLFAGGAIASKVDETTANLGRAQAELEASRREATTLARQAFAGVISGISQVGALESAVESGKSSVDANAAGYRVGVRINIDVLTANQQYHTALRDYAKARYETLLQGLKLKAAVGSLGEAHVAALNSVLVEEEEAANPATGAVPTVVTVGPAGPVQEPLRQTAWRSVPLKIETRIGHH